jgi:DNA invertase Pin-like site-specific DNA recombinase
MNIYTYCRVSTDRQTHESQLNELRDYCTRRNWRVTEEIVDTASGAKTSRTGLDRLLTLVRKGKVDVVLCYKLDRLGRSLAHLSQVIGELTRHCVALVVPSQGIDTTSLNPAAQLQLNILCAVAEFEREVIRERVNAGLNAARKRGQKLGRPNRTAVFAPRVEQMVREGKGTCAVSRELGISLGSASQLVAKARTALSAQTAPAVTQN